MAVLRSSEEWQQLLAEQAASGLSMRAFCQQRQIAVLTFLARKNRASLHSSVSVSAPPRAGQAVVPET